MPLTVHLCLLVASALHLLLFSTSCLGSQYEDCSGDGYECGGFEFSYPFGLNSQGCGDPEFQLHSCDSYDFPQINISGNEFHILKPSSLEIKGDRKITIVNDNLFGGKCSFSGNYSQFWRPGSHFRVLNTYTNLTLWEYCSFDSFGENIPGNLSVCGNHKYYFNYSLNLPLNLTGTPFCKAFQLPIDKGLPFNNQTLMAKGFEIQWSVDNNRDQLCSACSMSTGICGYNVSNTTMFLCYCPDGTSHPDKCLANDNTGGPNKAIIIGCSIGGVSLTAIALVLYFIKFYGKRRKNPSRGLATEDMEAAVLPRRRLSNLPIFSYEELRQATNCFHEENELGDGGFGSVYLGKLKDGRTVAVKRLYQDNSRRLEQFLNEVQIFSTLDHPRVVRLYGCTSADSPELLLVYEFVPNGTLADHLHGDRRGPRGLPWDARLNIAIQTAEGLAFLHNVDPPIFHRDVKSTNILLDENFNVKVADFGLCRLVPVNASHVTTAPQGTPGYVDPEYHECYQLTEKSDVYSFGVVLVEIISAKLAVDINRNRNEISLANMAKSKIQEGALNELVDPQLEIEINHKVKVMVSAVAELAFRCLASERDDRPHMKEVLAQLEEIRQSWDTSIRPGEQQLGSFSNIKEPLSPISVQDKWSRDMVQNLSSKE